MDLEINVGLSILPSGKPAYLATVKGSLLFNAVMGATVDSAAEYLKQELQDDGHNIIKINHIEY